MRGRTQAASLSAATAALPVLFWLSASIISLVMLRKGQLEGSIVLFCAVLPASIWLVFGGDPRPAITVCGTVLLAMVLRWTVSWVHTLAAAVGVGIVSGWLFEIALPETVADMVKFLLSFVAKAQDLTVEEEVRALWGERLCVGIIGAWQVTLMLCCLILARWWQSSLYNPGGFRKEFHELRLPPAMALGLMAAMVIVTEMGNPYLAGWVPVVSIPLLIAAIGLVHWSAGRMRMGRSWLIIFYILLLIMVQVFYPLLLLLGLTDSCFDLRRRLARSAGGPPTE